MRTWKGWKGRSSEQGKKKGEERGRGNFFFNRCHKTYSHNKNSGITKKSKSMGITLINIEDIKIPVQ